MMNLFSIFDPVTSNYFSLNWLSGLYVMMFIPSIYWYFPSRFNYFLMNIFKMMNFQFKILLVYKINMINMILLLSLFYYILLNNFLGMFPYIFTNSSHLVFSLSISLSLWFSLMIFGWFKNTNKMFIHLVPQGTPTLLMSFMVIIETISNFIRPSTLSIRLSANIIAGHLLMTLISSSCMNMMFISSMMVVLLQVLLVILEFSVSIIQSYVFTILVTLYKVESS